MSLIAVDRVSHRYDLRSGHLVLNDVSLAVDKNEIVGLVGESGCGKTTLGKAIAGLVHPTDGSIQFEERNVSSLKGTSFNHYRRSIQFVHQDPYASLNPALTIQETVGAGIIRHGLAGRRELRDVVRGVLKDVGLDPTDEFLRRHPHQLSGGQRQRVGVARALAVGPRLIVADEAVSMLDVSMRIALLDLLLRAKEEQGLSYVFITHDFGVMRYFAGDYRIGVLYYGRLVEEGTCKDVISHPRHPYTHALIRSVPVPDPRTNRAREAIVLRDADHADSPQRGCAFAPRCLFSQPRCFEEVPELRTLEAGHRTACFYPERIPESK